MVRSLAAIQKLLGDVRLAVLAAVAVLGIGAPDALLRFLVTMAGLAAVWVNRAPPRPEAAGAGMRGWVLTTLDLLAATLVLSIIGPDSLALVYVAITAATAALRLGLPGALISASAVIAVHVLALTSDGAQTQRDVLVVVLIRLALVTLAAVATARLRDLLLAHEALTVELQSLREHQA